MVDRPEFLKQGEVARLIPVVADSRKEQRAASAFLATMSAVPDFARALMSSISVRTGKRSVINSFTEIVFEEQRISGNDRPDGLIEHKSGKSSWSAVIEAKIGSAKIDESQVQRYVQLARDNGVSAVITISNEFVARPSHSPISVSKNLLRRVDLYHWSWKFILIEAILLHENSAINDPDQAYILREFIRFLSHESIGVGGYERMPPEWNDILTQVQSGAALRKTSESVQSVVIGWHQEIRDLSLRMSQHLSVSVRENLTRSHVYDVDQRIKDDCERFAESKNLTASLSVPGTVSDIHIDADINAKVIRVGMEISAPQDRARPSARLAWLMRQLKSYEGDDLFIRVKWPSRARDTVLSAKEIRDNPKLIDENRTASPRAFQVMLISSDARRFTGRSTFIQELEKIVPTFYDHVGQKLLEWRPKISTSVDEKKIEDGTEAVPKSDVSMIVAEPSAPRGNDHTELLEIPDFLRRL